MQQYKSLYAGPLGPVNGVAQFNYGVYPLLGSAPGDQTQNAAVVASNTLTFYGNDRCTDVVFRITGSGTRTARTLTFGPQCTFQNGKIVYIVIPQGLSLTLDTAAGGNLNCGPDRTVNQEGIGLVYSEGAWFCLEAEPNIIRMLQAATYES